MDYICCVMRIKRIFLGNKNFFRTAKASKTQNVSKNFKIFKTIPEKMMNKIHIYKSHHKMNIA